MPDTKRKTYKKPAIAAMRTGQHAFQINGRPGYPGLFPLSFDLDAVGQGIWRAHLHAQSVAEAAEILPSHTKERLCVFDVGGYWYGQEESISVGGCWYDKEEKRWRAHKGPGEIAELQGLTALVPDKDVIVISTEELPTLLGDLIHYQISLLDVEAAVDPEEVIDCVLKAMDTKWGKERESVLRSVSDSDVFLHSHDDCYLYVESRHLAHLQDHLRCLLKHYVSSRLGEPVPLPPFELVEDYLERHSSLAILDEYTVQIGGVLMMPCFPEPFSVEKGRSYPVAGKMLFDVGGSRWSFESAS